MPAVLILECREDDDPGSEGRFVKHMLDLMRIPDRYCKAGDDAEFIKLLSRCQRRRENASARRSKNASGISARSPLRGGLYR